MKVIGHIIGAFVVLARIGVGLAFAVLIATVMIQVVGRFTGAGPVWTEELTRYALLYLVAFGAGLAFRSGDLVNVDVVCESLPGRIPWVLRLVAAVATAGLALYLLAGAWRFTSIGSMQTSPALGIRMHYVHFTVWLLLALLALFAVLRIVGMLAGTEDGAPRNASEDLS
ncbi:TRAP transporter small permease [Acuticoccus sp. I52.16.1]|uniref:TRAP transporter small permease n=1 Tax=Acuticoccus sp. I52.16.1 TaxID=2928472 RepID=UPI001FD3D42B|nr:TRAP transporter small permease subunit [Acuticoccus sp. I52.16.1]UOM33010.1 TRAP transporter small permease [Acuticoccus sp. I52.16.1]